MLPYMDFRKISRPLPFENLIVEIGFGSGDYIIKLAKENKDEIFFGIEKSWIPVNKLLKKCNKFGIENLFFTKLDAYWAFNLLFKNRSVKRIIMNYPDPWLKRSHEEKRLTKRENLYVYAKKLINGGEIRIRTDNYPFVEFTLNESESLNAFSTKVSKPTIDEPLTKYEKRWLSIGKSIWEISLKKEREPLRIEIRKIKEVKNLFPTRIIAKELKIDTLLHREFKVEDSLYLKFFNAWQRNEDYALEVLISENGFLQSFIITIKKKDSYYIIDVSKFSEILKTEGIKKSLIFVSKIINKEIE